MTTALPEGAPRKSLHRCTPDRRFRWAPEHLRGRRGVDKDKEGKSTEELFLLLEPQKVPLKNLRISILNHGKLHTACW